MNFSFVLPTLCNKELLRKMLESFERTTKHKDKIEFLLAVDKGKLKSITNWLNKSDYSFDIYIYERKKTEDFTNDYYNFLANRCSGENIIAWNDDAWMRTKDWDEKILREIKSYGWSVYMLDILDTARLKYKNTFPCFPCVSRRAINTLGWLLHKDVPMYPADKITTEVYSEAGRIIPIRNVLIEHEHIVESDPSKSRMMDIFVKSQKKTPIININEDVIKLLKVASSEKNKKSSKFNRIINILKEK